jgi:hypothetical protein
LHHEQIRAIGDQKEDTDISMVLIAATLTALTGCVIAPTPGYYGGPAYDDRPEYRGAPAYGGGASFWWVLCPRVIWSNDQGGGVSASNRHNDSLAKSSRDGKGHGF